MSGIRCLYTEFWKDDFLLELSPEDKYFYIYLLTNDRCSNCGIYSFNAKFAAVELGYSVETVKTLINRFVNHEKILYSEKNGEIMIVNWFKYNVNINNRNTRVCINTCLKKIKTLSFIKNLYLSCIKDNPNNQSFIDEMFKDIDVSAIEDELQDDLEQQSNVEINDENEVESEENLVNKEEERKNNKSIGYVNGILNNWHKAGVKDMESYKDIIENKPKRYP